jgi:tetratricopeptide (TPR) repeat protein
MSAAEPRPAATAAPASAPATPAANGAAQASESARESSREPRTSGARQAKERQLRRAQLELKLLVGVLVATIALLEGAAALRAVRATGALHALIALLLHGCAAGASLLAARLRRRSRLHGVYFDLVLLTALAIPVFGPLLAWLIPSKKILEQGVNAHELFEQYEKHVRHTEAPYRRTLFTGDFDRDMARELDVESYFDVLASGDIHQKRDALSKLVVLGEPHHLALVRKSLCDPDQEVQLYAYGQISALEERYENAIDSADNGTPEGPRDPEQATKLATAHLAYAQSGVLDAVLATHHCELAIEFATRGRAASDPKVAMRLELLAKLGLGDKEGAQKVVTELLALDPDDAEARSVAIEFAYRARAFDQARVEIERFASAGHELRPWMRALKDAGRPSGDAAPAAQRRRRNEVHA